jgi:hypothetical protein
MKYVKLALAACSVIIASNAVAEDKFIFTEHYVSKPAAYRTFTTRDYAGVSTTSPCSDLVLKATYDMKGEFSFHSYRDDSAVFIYRAGTEATCYKRTFTMADTGNVYSTGNVQLTWDADSQSYTQATPEKVTVDVSKG